MLYPLVRPLLFALDPERAHRLAVGALQAAGKGPQRRLGGTALDLMGLRFPNRLGLAAGFDKSAEAVDGLGQLGFGFIEVGTVTLRPQGGQPPPRLFRLPRARALINRLGFPNDGADVIARRLRQRRYRGVVGVNIGKGFDTPIGRAVDDYVGCLRRLHAVSDYVAINISSPNTAALRDLHDPARLIPLLDALREERDRLVRGRGRPLPLLLKVSPDLDVGLLHTVAAVLAGAGTDGVIATNTTVSRPAALEAARPEPGGLSGAPLHDAALETIQVLRRVVGPTFPIVGVGGVDSAATALAMRRAGADLVQVYTGLVFRGPGLVPRCVAALSRP